MMKIRIVSYLGKPPTTSDLSAMFGENGGSIGRTPDNTLVLSDPERHVSRLHAKVTYAGGKFSILDLGTINAVRVNGRALGNGNQAILADADELAIGDYVLSVSLEEKKALAAGPGNQGFDIFADLAAPMLPKTLPPPPTQQLAASASIIPDDFDPFAAPASPPPSSLSASGIPHCQSDLSVDLGLSVHSGGNSGPSIDDLFNLSSVGSDPFQSGSPLGQPLGQSLPAVDNGLDLLAGLDQPKTPQAPLPDHTAELHGAFQVPKAVLTEPPMSQPEKLPAEDGFFLSWQNQAAVPPAQPVLPANEPPPTPIEKPAPPTKLASDEARPPTRSNGEAAPTDVLMQAFLDGAGMTTLPLPQGLTPEFMQTLGQLLRQSTQGTLDLLLARSMTKREVRADATLIMGKDNNPLKFSPTVEVAMTHLLTPMGGGFMTPCEAMQDAYADLRAHQFGFMAGMRAALAGVLSRFNPDTLEKRLVQKSMLDNLLSMNRRAKLWDLYISLYGEISQEVEEDFHTLFGKAFLRAYEEQVDRLREKPGS